MPKDISKFDNERQEVLNKMFIILGINEQNNNFELNKIDTDINLQNKILDLENDIKKYYNCSRWSCYASSNVKKKYLSLIRYVLKTMGYDIISKRKMVDKATYKKETYYYVIKQNVI